MPATKQCEKCSGSGTLSRELRKLEDGELLDPLDCRRIQLCDMCAGSGVVPENYAAAANQAG
jgi:hypothetical protein